MREPTEVEAMAERNLAHLRASIPSTVLMGPQVLSVRLRKRSTRQAGRAFPYWVEGAVLDRRGDLYSRVQVSIALVCLRGLSSVHCSGSECGSNARCTHLLAVLMAWDASGQKVRV